MGKQLRHSISAHNFPVQHTPFIGRDKELSDLIRLLSDPACRLLTLVGPGGIGKTRLAIQAVTATLETEAGSKNARFDNGVYFVPLQSIGSSDYLVSAVADAINICLTGHKNPAAQLLNYVRDKHMLLVLDNFEQLLPPSSSTLGQRISPLAAPTQQIETKALHSTENGLSFTEMEAGSALDLISELLLSAPGVKLLVTTREVLNLQEEWLYHVQGMSFPQPVPDSATDGTRVPEELENHSAVRLFAERAHRVRQDFSLSEEGVDVVRICQLVEGMPLAIELAASWTKTLPCSVIAAEIEHNIDFLATSFRNVPDRQRSIRAVFDQSWQLLSEKEQTAFKQLSVFRGGFSYEAAERVTCASLVTISALVDQSLLRPEPNGRYQIHELLRQFAAVQLAQSPEDVSHIYDSHCAYYADFLHERRVDKPGTRQRELITEIRAELENIRAAWNWAVGMSKVKEIQKASQPLSWFYQYQSRYLEGANAYEKAVDSLMREGAKDQTDLALASILVELAWFYVRLGRLEQAEAVIAQSRDIYSRHNIPPVPGRATDPLLVLGIIASIRGDYAASAHFGQEVRRVSEKYHHDGNLPFALYVLARASLAEGDLHSAREYAQQACAIVERTDDRWFMAYCLNELGNVASAQRNFTEAGQHYQTSYAIRQEFDDPEGMALALNHLGKIAVLQGEYEEARRLFQQSLAIYQKINDRGGLATSLSGLATTDCATGNYQAACQKFRQALHIASEIQYKPLILSILIGIGESMFRLGHEERGIELLAFAQAHPAADHEIRDRAHEYLKRHQPKLPPEVYASAIQRDRASDLETVSATLQAELETLESGMEIDTSVTDHPEQPSHQLLLEPLTDRESEVLELIADGLTNQQIAQKLILSVGTVKFYTSQIYGKLSVHSRTQAVARARELNMLA